MNNAVGKIIKQHLKENGISQAHIAEKLNVSRATVNYWLCSSTKIDVLDYANICRALNVPFDYFIPEHQKLVKIV